MKTNYLKYIMPLIIIATIYLMAGLPLHRSKELVGAITIYWLVTGVTWLMTMAKVEAKDMLGKCVGKQSHDVYFKFLMAFIVVSTSYMGSDFPLERSKEMGVAIAVYSAVVGAIWLVEMIRDEIMDIAEKEIEGVIFAGIVIFGGVIAIVAT